MCFKIRNQTNINNNLNISYNNMSFSKNGNVGTFSGTGELTQVLVNNNVNLVGVTSVIIEDYSSIGANAFQRATSLTSISIPNSVTSIGDFAFVECSNLTSISIPASVIFIGPSAFAGCFSLTRVIIPQTNGLNLQSPNSTKIAFFNAFEQFTSFGVYPTPPLARVTTELPPVPMVFQPATKTELQNAVNLWTSNIVGAREQAIFTYGNIDTWDTSKITDMTSLFQDKTSFNDPLTSWDTSKVTNMSGMFYGCTDFNKSVSNFDTSLVTTMEQMFRSCTKFNKSVSNFDTSLVTTMEQMFYGCSAFN
jgi:surface protein